MFTYVITLLSLWTWYSLLFVYDLNYLRGKAAIFLWSNYIQILDCMYASWVWQKLATETSDGLLSV